MGDSVLGQVSDLSFIQSARSQKRQISSILTVLREMPHNNNKK